jgi:CxxC motif-containing protein (DUF1111 family)
MRPIAISVFVSFLLAPPSGATLDSRVHNTADADSDAAMSGGDSTVFDVSVKAFGFPCPTLTDEHRSAFFVGRSFFNENWVVAPASTKGRDGLGPLFNARSCSACHLHDGRSEPPASGKPMVSMLIRLSVPGNRKHSEPLPDKTYGGQLQGQGIPGVPAEADVFVNYTEQPGKFADGEPFSLRRPSYCVTNLGYGPLSSQARMSPRVAPAMIGMGLLETVSERDLLETARSQKESGSGIAGQLNYVWDEEKQRMAAGKFGWKAEQPTVLQQIAAAFAGDMGLTSVLFPHDDHTAFQEICDRQPNGGNPEVADKILNDVATYSRTLAVPARRNWTNETVLRGERVFRQSDCAMCHVPKLRTGTRADLPELSNQTIHPYTDMLLHDMGEELSDGRPVFKAGARDWRTPPLWGIGLQQNVNGHTCFLHDGRARNAAEAILWHGGEAARARENFRSLSKTDRIALIAFLDSL